MGEIGSALIHPRKGMPTSLDRVIVSGTGVPKQRRVEETYVSPVQRELLRRLALNDEKALNAVISGSDPQCSELLDDKTRALVRLAGVITVGAEETTLRAALDLARGSGARDEEILGTVISIAPMMEGTSFNSTLPLLSSVMESG